MNSSPASRHCQKAHRVAVTGLGIVSSLGTNRQRVTESLRLSRSGITLLKERKDMGFRSGLSGVIRDFSPAKIERRYRKKLPEFGLWAWDAIHQAISQAGISSKVLGEDPMNGMIFGNDCSVVSAVEQQKLLEEHEDTGLIGSAYLFRGLTSTITLNLATKLKLMGSVYTVSGACASGAMAIGQAAELIASGRQKRMICGGAQEISYQSMSSFDGLGAFSIRENEPAAASRPFDEERDGLVPSGGAAAVFLEEYQSAIDRGAPIIAEILGYGNCSDGYHLSVPSGDGLQRAMSLALSDAELTPEGIDLIMAHATSTPVGDEKEAEAVAALFNSRTCPRLPLVAATKSLTGHEFWMAGGSQLVYGLLMTTSGFVAAHPNLTKPLPAAAGLDIVTELREVQCRHILCNAAGFGGTNGCLVVRLEDSQ
ncbi:MAG: beta-ketoacyl-[acyl-carrier-protein] synthase family protein [Thermodesulfobacteriota bacterium]